MYGGGRTVDRKISVGESSEEWLILGSAMRAMETVGRKWEQWRVCGVVRVSKVDWGCYDFFSP